MGSYQTSSTTGGTLIESRNGTSWSLVPSPSPGTLGALNGVSCVSAAACTAVGSYQTGNTTDTLIESWNGTSWSVIPSPNLGASSWLYAVSCTSATVCTAAGIDYSSTTTGPANRTVIESWDGTSWSIVPSPNPARRDQLDGVSCASVTACIALGSYGFIRPLIESGTASG